MSTATSLQLVSVPSPPHAQRWVAPALRWDEVPWARTWHLLSSMSNTTSIFPSKGCFVGSVALDGTGTFQLDWDAQQPQMLGDKSISKASRVSYA